MVNQGDDMQKEIGGLIVFLLRVDKSRVLEPTGSVEPVAQFSLSLFVRPSPSSP